MTTIGLASLSKLVESRSDKIIDVSGSDNLYFIYPSVYGPLSNIFDDSNNSIFASFSSNTQLLSSPTGLWASVDFIVYQWNGVSQIGPPSVNFQFEY
jgi:hypothetical protein